MSNVHVDTHMVTTHLHKAVKSSGMYRIHLENRAFYYSIKYMTNNLDHGHFTIHRDGGILSKCQCEGNNAVVKGCKNVNVSIPYTVSILHKSVFARLVVIYNVKSCTYCMQVKTITT